jgi:molecular chaperone GrpE
MSDIPINEDNLEPTQSGGDGAPTADDLQKLEKLQEERDALFDRLARATAEFKNMQKRLHADKEQAVQFANSQLIKSLLPVIDNFERALVVDPNTTDAAGVLKGMQIIHDQLMSVLKQQSVDEIAPQPGTPFDPNHQQALMQQPDDRYGEPTVTQLLQKGYTLHGRVLRPAQVAVSKTS